MNAYTESREKILEAAHASETLEKKPKSKKPKVRFRNTVLERPSSRLPLNPLFSTSCPQQLTSSVCACNSRFFVCVCLPSVLASNRSSSLLPCLFFLPYPHPSSSSTSFLYPRLTRPTSNTRSEISHHWPILTLLCDNSTLFHLCFSSCSTLALSAMKRIFLESTHTPSRAVIVTAVAAGLTT